MRRPEELRELVETYLRELALTPELHGQAASVRYAISHGADGARRLADEAAGRARERLAAVSADTSILLEIVDGLATRTA